MDFTKETFHFGPHELQYLEVTILRPDRLDCKTVEDGESLYWVIFIHGGAWRDPLINANSFDATQSTLLSYHDTHGISTIRTSVVAFASLNYRLSAHPSYPQPSPQPQPQPPLPTPSGQETEATAPTPATQYRNAKHPDHIQDITSGIHLLQQKYGFTENYILVGHSAGATLAFQTVMADLLLISPSPLGINNGLRGDGASREVVAPRSTSTSILAPIVPPKAIIGVSGIYDLRRLHLDYAHIPVYGEILVGAFDEDYQLSGGGFNSYEKEGTTEWSEDRTHWDTVSPAHGPIQPGTRVKVVPSSSDSDSSFGSPVYKDGESIARGWTNGRLVVIASSVNDGLVNDAQHDIMTASLENGWKMEGQGGRRKGREVIRLADLQHEHDDIWKNGDELARVIVVGLDKLISLS